MSAHVCQECGLLHDTLATPVDPAVEIARIEAENRLAIAKLQARSDERVAETLAEADVDVAQAETEAVLDVITADAILGEADEAVAEEAAEPVVIVQDVDQEQEQPEVPAPMPEEHEPHHETRKRRGLGAW